jgi:hypothetical protein
MISQQMSYKSMYKRKFCEKCCQINSFNKCNDSIIKILAYSLFDNLSYTWVLFYKIITFCCIIIDVNWLSLTWIQITTIRIKYPAKDY